MNKTSEKKFQRLSMYREYSPAEMKAKSQAFLENQRRRRTVREYSHKMVDREVIENCLLAAGSAPSGANLQPWHFAVVSDPVIKSRIREAAEQEEREFYGGRAPQEWLDVLAPLGTDEHKPFLEIAPWLIVIFSRTQESHPDGSTSKTYYAQESTGIATGVLITALHIAGLATLTHTPSPMKFLNEILNRPKTERPFLLLVVGYPAENATVPAITKKPLDQIASFHVD